MLLEKQSVLNFEEWIYNSDELENSIDEDSHLDFISLNYKINGAYYELINLINKQIDKVDFLNWKILTELNNVISRKGNYHLSIINFYDLYCKGYGFMDNLAFGYGLTLSCPYSRYGVDNYDELSLKQQGDIVEDFYPEIIVEVEKVLNWINNGDIILKENTDEFGQLNYVDLRINEEKKTTTYIIEKVGLKNKKWWEVWKL